MLDFYHRLARRLYGYRWVLWLLCGLAVALFSGALLFRGTADDQWATLGAIAVLLWTICLLTLAYSFNAPLPAAGPEAGWFARQAIRIRRGFLWLMALAMSLLTGLVIFASLRIAAVLVRGL
jgi:hypothetical protein